MSQLCCCWLANMIQSARLDNRPGCQSVSQDWTGGESSMSQSRLDVSLPPLGHQISPCSPSAGHHSPVCARVCVCACRLSSNRRDGRCDGQAPSSPEVLAKSRLGCSDSWLYSSISTSSLGLPPSVESKRLAAGLQEVWRHQGSLLKCWGSSFTPRIWVAKGLGISRATLFVQQL